jgi:hypothetical protein
MRKFSGDFNDRWDSGVKARHPPAGRSAGRRLRPPPYRAGAATNPPRSRSISLRVSLASRSRCLAPDRCSGGAGATARTLSRGANVALRRAARGGCGFDSGCATRGVACATDVGGGFEVSVGCAPGKGDDGCAAADVDGFFDACAPLSGGS